ncbi:MAG: glycerate kinase [Proteobacteria bacterium]|nr:glycerate kinase [Pseudomonadota bacterium]MYB88737.1 glycerate kinase [Pseudomonadota bacterium]
MKKIVIAPDSFKGNLTSLEVAVSIEKGIRRVLPNATCVKIPMADGGEGTVQSLIDAAGGKLVRKRVKGPAGKIVTACYGWLPGKKTAVIEMAEASGLPLVDGHTKNPLKTTTYGTGQLILDALDRGAEKIILGIGGSATNDGGVGMAQALGVRFMNARGRGIKESGSGGMLAKIQTIDATGLDARVSKVKILVACDVKNPLHGKQGAAHVFGPQKGATPKMVAVLDANLKHLGRLIKRDLKKDVARMPGAGAAGGLGAGLVAFAGATLKSGVDIVLRTTELEKYVKGADLVITGEGKVDFQTAFGKTPSGVARAAKKHRVPVVAIGGALSDDAHNVFAHGIDGIASAAAKDMSLDEALRDSRPHLENVAERVIRMILIGKKMAEKKHRMRARSGPRKSR